MMIQRGNLNDVQLTAAEGLPNIISHMQIFSSCLESWVSHPHSFRKPLCDTEHHDRRLAHETTQNYHSQTMTQSPYFIPSIDSLRHVQYSLEATIKMALRCTVLPERMIVQTSWDQKALRA